MPEANTLALLIQVVALPIVYLFWIVWLNHIKQRKGLAVSIALFSLSYAAGILAVTNGRSPSASVAILFLPYESTLCGALGLAFAYGWSAKNTAARIGGRLALTAAVLLIAGRVVMS